MNHMWLWDLSIEIRETDMNVQMLDDQSLCSCVILTSKRRCRTWAAPTGPQCLGALSWPGPGSGQSGWTLFELCFWWDLVVGWRAGTASLSPLKSGSKRLGNHMSHNRGLVNKFSYILPSCEDHLCVPLWRNPKDMGGKQGSTTVYTFAIFCVRQWEDRTI